MAKRKKSVDPIDAAAAICDLQTLYRKRGLSIDDLAIELDWSPSKVYEFFTGNDFPSREDFEAMASVLNYSLDF